MRVWCFTDPWDGSFAYASHVGTWSEPEKGRARERTQPLVIEWEPGSDVIGDFTWLQFSPEIVVATQRVGRALLQRFRGFELGPVEMIQNPKLRRPQRITRRTKPRV